MPDTNVDAKVAIRETIEDYLHCVDAKDWDGIAACFASNATSHYNFEPYPLLGGDSVAAWIRLRLTPYLGTNHALSHLHIDVEGDVACCASRVTATLLHESEGERRISVRTIQYRDELRWHEGRWRICARRHEPLWQYEVPAQSLRL